MKKYNFIFIVLCYVNTDDLRSFLNSVKNINGAYKIIVVNSFHDEISKEEFYKIALANDCDFINVPNKGYGYGNNRGIEYAQKNYEYDFLVVSNPDIEFKYFDINLLYGMKDCFIGPNIKTKINKNQNPYKPITMWLINGMEYLGIKQNIKLLWIFGAAINKIIRSIYILLANMLKNPIRVDTLHGSCMLMGYDAVKKLKGRSLYDENMFLYCEEDEVGYKAKQYDIKIYYDMRLKILHKEDGSTSLLGDMNSRFVRESYIYCYEKWNR